VAGWVEVDVLDFEDRSGHSLAVVRVQALEALDDLVHPIPRKHRNGAPGVRVVGVVHARAVLAGDDRHAVGVAERVCAAGIADERLEHAKHQPRTGCD
jgi:hypothetical protein